MIKNTALLCGLVRDVDTFNEKITILNDWRAEGIIDCIVVSTWIGELAKYPGLREKLDEDQILIVETSEPEIYYKGHAWHQMKTLAFGLEACDENSAVLKLRADKIELNDVIRGTLADRKLKSTTPPAAWPHIFEAKIVVLGGILTQPFFFNDMLYYGLQRDLCQLVNFDMSMQFSGALMNVEQLFFLAPFQRHFPIFYQFFKINWGLLHFQYQHSDSRELIIGSLDYKFFQEAILTWFLIADAYFQIGFAANRGRDVESYSACTITDFFDIDNEMKRPGVDYYDSINTFNFNSNECLEAFAGNSFKPDRLSISFLKTYSRVTSFEVQKEYRHQFLGLDSDAFHWAEFARRFPWGDMALVHLQTFSESLWQVQTPSLQIFLPQSV